MPPQPGSTAFETLPSAARVHVVGAGPVGLLLTALMQSMDGFSVHLYEKRPEYTRTRMVQLASYLVANSVESYRTDSIDGDSVEAVFDRLFSSASSAESATAKARRERYRKSILDLVAEDAGDLRKNLGGADQRKLDEYLSGVREIELGDDVVADVASGPHRGRRHGAFEGGCVLAHRALVSSSVPRTRA